MFVGCFGIAVFEVSYSSYAIRYAGTVFLWHEVDCSARHLQVVLTCFGPVVGINCHADHGMKQESIAFARKYISFRNNRLGLRGPSTDPVLERAGNESQDLAACFQGWARIRPS